MNILAVGDVHGCLNTFKNLLNKYWNRDEELLIQVGDLVDRGNFSPQALLYAFELNQQKPNAVFLKGNHEYELLKHLFNGPNDNWLRQGGDITLKQFQEAELIFAIIQTG
ncbi:MAG: metallophosphoesterase [Ignavibacteria bacterium]|nr:metallophosphoesterase [Ignavibacteria bacterium]